MLYLSTITPAFRPWAGTRAGGKRGSVPSNLGRAIARATCGRGSVAHSCKDYTTCEQIKWGGSLPLSSVDPRCGKGTSLLHVLRLSFSEKLFSPTFLMTHGPCLPYSIVLLSSVNLVPFLRRLLAVHPTPFPNINPPPPSPWPLLCTYINNHLLQDRGNKH